MTVPPFPTTNVPTTADGWRVPSPGIAAGRGVLRPGRVRMVQVRRGSHHARPDCCIEPAPRLVERGLFLGVADEDQRRRRERRHRCQTGGQRCRGASVGRGHPPRFEERGGTAERLGLRSVVALRKSADVVVSKAPDNPQVSGIVDSNGDGKDDDGKLQVTVNGRSGLLPGPRPRHQHRGPQRGVLIGGEPEVRHREVAAGEDLSVQHGEEAVGVLGPAPPRRRDRRQLVGVAQSVLDRLVANDDARPDRPRGCPTTRATVGVGERPGRAAGRDVGEPGRLDPAEEVPAGVGLGAVVLREQVIQLVPADEQRVGRRPGERGVVAVAHGEHAAGPQTRRISRTPQRDRSGAAAPGARARRRTKRRRSRARRRHRSRRYVRRHFPAARRRGLAR